MVFRNIARIIMVQIFLYSLPEHLSDDMSRSRPAVVVDACLESKMSAIAFRRPVLPEVINSSKLFGTSTSAIVSVKVVFFIENATNFAVSKICKNNEETCFPNLVLFHACQLENKYQKDTYFMKGLFAFNKQRKNSLCLYIYMV